MRRDDQDDALLAAAAAGDDAAFATFFLRHQAAVFGLLLRRTRDRQRSRTLTAETFACALRRASGFRPGEQPAYDWLLAIAEEKSADPSADAARMSATTPTPEDPWHPPVSLE